MKTEEDSKNYDNTKDTSCPRKRSASREGFDDDSPTTTSSDGFRSSDQERDRKRKQPPVQSVYEIISDARNRARIRRQKKKKYVDDMQREVLSLSHDNAFLRTQNEVLETLLEDAKESVVKKELRKAQKTLQNNQAISAMCQSLFDRQAYATCHAPSRPMAQQYNCKPSSMQGIFGQPCNENALMRQILVENLLRNKSRASHVERSHIFGLDTASANSINPQINLTNYERNETRNSGVGLALNLNVSSNSYPGKPLFVRNEYNDLFPNEAISPREVATRNPITMANHAPASAVLGQIIMNEAKNLVQSFAGSLPIRNVDSPHISAIGPVNANQPLSRNDSNILWPSNPGNEFLDRGVNKNNAILNLLAQGKKPSANHHRMATTFTPNTLASSMRAHTSAKVSSNESARNNTATSLLGENGKTTSSHKSRRPSGSSPSAV